LSRESDDILQREAMASNGAILVSFWRLPGMAADTGTSADWLPALSSRVATIHCCCQPEIAARRFIDRQRHPGHLDRDASYDSVLASLQRLARLDPMNIGPRIIVDTSHEPDLDDALREIRRVLEHAHS
jgi:hypothetical protein